MIGPEIFEGCVSTHSLPDEEPDVEEDPTTAGPTDEIKPRVLRGVVKLGSLEERLPI